MVNEEIRNRMFQNGITQWKLAKMLGISESSVWRLLRDELPPEKAAEILDTIDKGGKGNDKARTNSRP